VTAVSLLAMHDHVVASSSEAERRHQRDLVRKGYDAISLAYRSDNGEANPASPESTATYISWVEELRGHLRPGSRVLDLGCGAGVPATQALVEGGFEVTGIDISTVQIDRARKLVPKATFVCADMVEWDCVPNSFHAIVSLYALIHVPLEDQRDLIPRLARWLTTGGRLLAIVGFQRWTGVEDYMGAPMFWDHADTDTYLAWLGQAGLELLWHRYVPEGASGHTLIMAERH
jgi:2-polyprenyl-3-methyl-5-hydroxy-6-metoxy-1,4-benzoquinol methylase